MRANIFIYLHILFLLGIYSCKVTEKQAIVTEVNDVVAEPADSTVVEDKNLVEVKLYKSEQTRHFRLIHTKLEVSFDWEKQYMHGIATLILEPFFYAQSNLVLNAKGFDIHNVSIIKGENHEHLNFKYDGKRINIDLGKEYERGQKINILVNYTAKPDEGEYGDNFNNDQKGLYFINPHGDESDKPQQIWTHGETSSNSRWFPTIDAPNQKSTQEMYITVNEKYNTLSNGILVYSQSNSDNTRTDYWKMDKPHAPYLFMMAVGEFSIVEDKWEGITVDYYVEPEYEAYAKNIFGNTPEMIGYFSELLNYPFPWIKYNQVVVRDFVSGAMENTTASVFMEDLNVDNRALIDYNWDDIIAHELFHQWFGDLVTCESWANLPLNESFATYAEFLWKNHKYGVDEGAYQLYEELQSYLEEAESKKEDLIRYYYDEEEDMFDSHSYAKGGLILHMLRNYLGDEAFFKSLEYYLKSHEFGKAEVHDLRLAFERISGEDLNWFFNQWFLAAGHPKLRVEESYDQANGKYIVKVWQEQDIEKYPVFKLPLNLDVWENGNKTGYTIEIDKTYQEFEFGDVENPDLILIDSDFTLVGEIEHNKKPEQFQYQFDHYGNNVRARIDALEYFLDAPINPISRIVLIDALQDSFWILREKALQVFEVDSSDLFSAAESKIKIMATNDPNSLVKARALGVLAEKEKSQYIDIFEASLYDSSYSVSGMALYAYLQSGVDDTDSVLVNFRNETNFNITSSVADYYIQQQDHGQYIWFAEKLQQYNGGDLWYFIKLFGMYLVAAPDDQIAEGVKALEKIAKNHYQFYNRLSAYQSIELLSDNPGVPEMLEGIRENESDPRLRDYFK